MKNRARREKEAAKNRARREKGAEKNKVERGRRAEGGGKRQRRIKWVESDVEKNKAKREGPGQG